MRYLAFIFAVFQVACVSADNLDSEHQAINREIHLAQSFIDAANKLLLGKESHLSQHQKELLKRSSFSSKTLIELDCKLLTLDDPVYGFEGSEHRLQLDACILSELQRRQNRMKHFLCPESYFEGHPPDCEELRKLEGHLSRE